MNELQQPPIPPDVDLRKFPFMPLDVTRLFNSRFHAVANDAEWRAGVTLWLKSWQQIPAASLPDDDIELCRLAELGRDHRTWQKIRAKALHGWIKCADGRLYHPTVAEKAIEAWIKKEKARAKGKAGNEKRWGRTGGDAQPAIGKGGDSESQMDSSGDMGNEPPAIAQGVAQGSPDDRNRHGHGEREGLKNNTPGAETAPAVSALTLIDNPAAQVEKPSTRKAIKFDAADMQLATILLGYVKAQLPGKKFHDAKTLPIWANELRLMRENDFDEWPGFDTMADVLVWIFNESVPGAGGFSWARVILSASNFRKHILQLLLQYRQRSGPKTTGSNGIHEPRKQGQLPSKIDYEASAANPTGLGKEAPNV